MARSVPPPAPPVGPPSLRRCAAALKIAALAACGGGGPLFDVPTRAVDAGSEASRGGSAPGLLAAPSVLDFGWVPPGRGRERLVRWVGRKPGVDRRVVDWTIEGPDAASFELVDTAPLPWRVSARAGRSDPPLTTTVRVAPARAGPVRATLRLELSAGPSPSVELRADARAPPGLFFEPASLDLPAGRAAATLSVRNRGEAALTVALHPPTWSGPRVTLPPPVTLAAGRVASLAIGADDGPAGTWSGAVDLRTNAPGWARTSVPLRVERAPGGPPAFTLDVVAEDRSDAVRLDPWRLEVAVVGPDDARVTMDAPAWTATEGGRLRATARGEPRRGHRVRGTGPLTRGDYRVELTYLDDCRAAPTALVASGLGLGLEALLAAWLGGAPPAGGALAAAIESACVDRSGLDVALRVRIDGVDVAAPAARLEARGDRWSPGAVRVGAGMAWEGET